MADKCIEQLQEELRKFTHERDWEQFHNGKDLALALSIEASEVNQLFLWKHNSVSTTTHKQRNRPCGGCGKPH